MEAIKCLPVMEELDTEPSVEELSKVIDSLPCGEAPVMDGIPPKVIKCRDGVLLPHLHERLCQFLSERAMPRDIRDADIITLGKRSDCNSY